MEIPEVLLKLFPVEQIIATLVAAFLASVLTELIKPFIKKWQADPDVADLWILAVVWSATEAGTIIAYLAVQWAQITAVGILASIAIGAVATLLAIGGWSVLSNILAKMIPKKPTT